MDGIVVINKPPHVTSHQVVREVRYLFPGVKAGHSGTLDPMATGILPVCIGKATRIAEYVMDLPKTYRAGIAFGEITDTEDSTGKILEKTPVPLYKRARLEEILSYFIGEIEQIPPAYSAVKYKGKPLYYWARRGKEAPRSVRKAYIYELKLLEYNPEHKPHLLIEVKCSKGTYIRTLAFDIGRAAGCGGHLHTLARTAVGPMNLDNAMNLERIKELAAAGSYEQIVSPMDIALKQYPCLTLGREQIKFLKDGRPVNLSGEEIANELSPEKPVRIYDQDYYFRALALPVISGAEVRLKTLKFLSD